MYKKRALLAIVYVILLFLLSACTAKSTPPVEVQDFMMGTVITQKVYGENAEKAVEEVSARMKDIEARMTVNAPGGEINRLNEAAGKERVKLGSDTMYVLDKALKFSELSMGAFDVTIGPLVKAWGIFTDSPRVPDKAEIDRLKGLIDYSKINIDKSSLAAKLEQTGQGVDLGGIAKGYAGDEAISIYRKHGIKSAYVNLGGNVVVLGKKPDGKPWKIGIQNPRSVNGEYIGIVDVVNKAVVSSGDYERFFEEDGVRYHHILDPKTGYPSESGLIGVTIVADVSVDADALSTATFILGLDKGMELVQKLSGVEAIFVTSDKKVYVTDGLRKSFKFSDKSKEFAYVEKR